MLAQRRPDEQVYVGPTSVSNVGPTESTTVKIRWSNVVMLSGMILQYQKSHSDVLYRFREILQFVTVHQIAIKPGTESVTSRTIYFLNVVQSSD